ncbi:UDP-phosphate galactose phosphotransferase [Bibersteinia trehalosi Y31]|uniref:UDP-phosphate galactose phosphotransferase n=1 Tax=Bibersteinia trehalosi Y31 TaxID=1261658 RepID=A0A179CXH5_BIBTR|nr:undecaprenyl-phosphate galactose phosphotransferase WbaP [Bibersteinia trehalosi]OAQ14267.1 UDP-phosphate galactose phosphotransferase [Bibersteinia trehalosi Y31]
MNNESISKYAMIILDLCSLFATFWISLLIISSMGDINQYIPQNDMEYRIMIHLLLSCLCVIWFWSRLRHYTYRKPFWFELKEILRTLLIFSVIDLAMLSLSKLYISRYVWLFTWLSMLILVPLVRISFKTFLIKKGIILKDTIIIGGGQNAIDTYNAIINESYLGLNVIYFITDQKSKELDQLGKPIIFYKNLNHAWENFQENTQFIIALEDQDNSKKEIWIRNLTKRKYRFVSIVPSLRGIPLYSTDMSFLFSYDILLLRLNHNLSKRSSQIIKRIIDIIVSSLLIITLSPLLLVIWLLITFDGGNALFSHKRVGKDGNLFSCWKFRTMRKDADKFLENYLKENPSANVEWQKERKLRNDPRVTQIGQWIRKTSLDELPQLFNVLYGDMSLVGPRPITNDELVYYHSSLDYYFMAKPGMTGLWQVSGRNNVSYDQRVYFDSWYVKNWSVWNDFVILCKTIPAVFKRTGAI